MELNKLGSFPELQVGRLTHWAINRISGDDRHTYLQGQLTAEIQGLAEGTHTLSGHCDPKGKLWSVLRFVNAGKWLWMIQPQSAMHIQLPELKKYSVFSKVTIEDEAQYQLIAVIGKQAKDYISEHFGPTIARQGGLLDDGYCISFANQPMRYLLIIPSTQADLFVTKTPATEELDALWQGLNIVAGLPSLTEATSRQFIPQALNLQHLDAISFTKGCYTGQEIIARAKYRGTNKRATLRFVGQSSTAIPAGSDLEMEMNGNWRRCGTILNSFRHSDGYTELLAVVRKDSEADAHYRIEQQPESQLTLGHLPYSLKEE